MSRSDRGLSESVQWAVVFPALAVCVLGLIQAGVWLNGVTVVRAAAATVAETEALAGVTAGSGEAAGRRLAHERGVEVTSIEISSTTERIDVRVVGRVPIFFDVGQGSVTGTAAAPRERTTR